MINNQLKQAQADLEFRRQGVTKQNGPTPIAAILPTAVTAHPDQSPMPVIERKRVLLADLDPNHHPLVAEAIQAARDWSERKSGSARQTAIPNAGLVLVARQAPMEWAEQAANEADVGGEQERLQFVDSWLLDRSGYGCGKTHIAKSCLWSRFLSTEDGTPLAPAGKFYKAMDLLQLLCYGNSIGELVPAGSWDGRNQERIGGTPVLVVDDVGAEGVLPYIAGPQQEQQRQMLYLQIINYCLEESQPGVSRGISLIMTANMSLDQLSQHIGGRAWSRLMELAPAGYMIDLSGVPDYRRKESGR